MNHSSTGFVLSVVPYKEHDAIVHFLSFDKGLLRLVLRGYYKVNTKQSLLGMSYSKVMYHFIYREDSLLRIIGGQLIDSYLDYREDYEWLVGMSLVSELVIKHHSQAMHTKLYEAYETLIAHWTLDGCLGFMSDLLELLGYKPVLDGCVVCSHHKINSFSISLGGYLCPQHSEHKMSYDLLVLIAMIFKHKDITDYDEKLKRECLLLCIEYLEYHSEIKINTKELLTI